MELLGGLIGLASVARGWACSRVSVARSLLLFRWKGFVQAVCLFFLPAGLFAFSLLVRRCSLYILGMSP